MMECAKRVLTLGAGRELIEGDFVMIRMESGSSALYLLRMIGLLGEFPISFLDQLEGYYDYNRRRITELVREGYLRDWKFKSSLRNQMKSLEIFGFRGFSFYFIRFCADNVVIYSARFCFSLIFSLILL